MILGIKFKQVSTANVFKLYLNNFQTIMHAGFDEEVARGMAQKYTVRMQSLELIKPARATLSFIDFVDIWKVPIEEQ